MRWRSPRCAQGTRKSRWAEFANWSRQREVGLPPGSARRYSTRVRPSTGLLYRQLDALLRTLRAIGGEPSPGADVAGVSPVPVQMHGTTFRVVPSTGSKGVRLSLQLRYSLGPSPCWLLCPERRGLGRSLQQRREPELGVYELGLYTGLPTRSAFYWLEHMT